MKRIKLMILKAAILITVIIIAIGTFLYFYQEKLIFFPEKLASNYQFQFGQKFEEQYYTMNDGKRIHALHFKADSSRGCILYLHGNAGSLEHWGDIAYIYTRLGYDVLMPDYRGFGKSEGGITSERQLLSDVQILYNELKKKYNEQDIVLLGYSLGSGLSAYLAANNAPQKLILLTPYYNFEELVKHLQKWAPTFMLKYKIPTNKYILKIKAPIYIFHGLDDELIPFSDSKRLYEHCKPEDKLFLIENQMHSGFNVNEDYQKELVKILE